MRILPNAMASSFIYARLCPVGMSWSEHFAATLFQYLKDGNRIPRWQCLIVGDHFLVESNWEDEVLKQADLKGMRGQTDHKQFWRQSLAVWSPYFFQAGLLGAIIYPATICNDCSNLPARNMSSGQRAVWLCTVATWPSGMRQISFLTCARFLWLFLRMVRKA